MSHCAPGTRQQYWYAQIVSSVRLARRHFWVAICFVAALQVELPAARAQRGVEQQAKRDAIEAIPFDQLAEEAHAKLWSVVSRPSLYRQMPPTVIPSDPDLYVFLVRHPEVIVNMWDLMGITKVTINRNADYVFDASDGAGTDSRVELIYGDQNLHVMYADGTYEGPLLKKVIRGRCVLVLRSNYSRAQDNNTYVTSRLDVFLQIDNVGAELFARTLHPLVGRTADQNFIESVKFLGQVTQAAETRPQRLHQLTKRLTKIKPPIRRQFSTLTTIAGRRALQRRTDQSTDAVQRRPTRSSQTVSRVYSVDGTDTAATGAADGSEPAASLR
ncbi:MAG TPA: hypothetical protein QF564_32290 [Pirellulaceae bacterium]|nr:hypothetical protein [Pirellulaceae bacterium]